LRAPTPSAAVELATPDQNDIFEYLENYLDNLTSLIDEKISLNVEEVDSIMNSYGFRQAQDLVKNKIQTLDNLFFVFNSSIENKFKNYFHILDLQNSRLNSMNIDNVLKRGFAYVKQNEKIIGRLKNFDNNSMFSINFFDGEIKIDGKEKRK
jgi:exodeoxyribonuclease VII large subunit